MHAAQRRRSARCSPDRRSRRPCGSKSASCASTRGATEPPTPRRAAPAAPPPPQPRRRATRAAWPACATSKLGSGREPRGAVQCTQRIARTPKLRAPSARLSRVRVLSSARRNTRVRAPALVPASRRGAGRPCRSQESRTCVGWRGRMATRVGVLDCSSAVCEPRARRPHIRVSDSGERRRRRQKRRCDAAGRGAEVRVEAVKCTRTVRMLASSSLTISCMNAPRCIERDACRSTAAQSPSTGTSFADAGCISLYPLPTPPTRVTGTAAAAGGIRSLTRPSTSAARSPADFATSAATSPADLAVSCAIVPSRSTERFSCTKILNSSRSSRPEASTSYLRKSCSDQSGAPSVGGGPACSLAR
mmetsp:Transcript_19888/g.59284  ORF Transcript_19888/g.59284 Transcript_19888/m.59284 type:complete len:361 (-) Transcript_19888:791-1873(-)